MAKSVAETKVVYKDNPETEYDPPTDAKDFVAFLKFRDEKQRRLANQREKLGTLHPETKAEERRRRRQWTKLFPIPRVIPIIQTEHRCCLAQLNGDQWIRCTRPYSSYSNTKQFQDNAVRKKAPLAVDSEATHSNICIYHHNVVNYCKRGQDCSKQQYLFLEYDEHCKDNLQVRRINIGRRNSINDTTFRQIKAYESKWSASSTRELLKKDDMTKVEIEKNTVYNKEQENTGHETLHSMSLEAGTSLNHDIPTVDAVDECYSEEDEEQYEDIYRVIEHVQDGININEEGMSECSTFDGEIEVDDGEFDEILIEEVDYKPPPGPYGEYLTYNNELDVDKWNSDGILKYIDDTINRPPNEIRTKEDVESDAETLSTSSESSCASEEAVFRFTNDKSAEGTHRKHKKLHKKALRVLNSEENEKNTQLAGYLLEDAAFFDGRDPQEIIDEIPGGAEADNLRVEEHIGTSVDNEDMEFRDIVEYRVHGDATHWMDQIRTPHSAKEEESSESEGEKEDSTEVATGLDTLSAASLRRYRAYFNIPTNSGFTKSRMLQGVEAHLRATPVNTVHSIAAFLNSEVRDMRPEDYETLEQDDNESDTEYEEELIDEEESESSEGPHGQQSIVDENDEKKDGQTNACSSSQPNGNSAS